MTPNAMVEEMLVEVSSDEIVDLTSRLIAASSFGGDERQVMQVAREFLESHGLQVQTVSRDPKRPNLVVTVGSGRPVLAMNGHLDTVPIDDPTAWKTDPLSATLDNGRLYGLGALDMKGACAVMMLTAVHLNRYADQLKGSLQLQIVTDEETGCYYGTIFIVEEIKAGRLDRPDMVLNCEPTDLRVRNAERGTFKFNVIFRGRASHTARSRVEGINPIEHAAYGVIALQNIEPREHPDVGPGVISVNMIDAGVFLSSVPGECTLLVDRRMVPGETDESCMAEAEAAIREALKDVPEADFEVKHMIDSNGRKRYSPPNVSPWESPVMQAMADAHELVTGRPAERFLDWSGASDARLFRYEGIDTVTYGPTGEHPHGANEYVDVASLTETLKVYIAAASNLLSGN